LIRKGITIQTSFLSTVTVSGSIWIQSITANISLLGYFSIHWKYLIQCPLVKSVTELGAGLALRAFLIGVSAIETEKGKKAFC
jgi:hypothetical protein